MKAYWSATRPNGQPIEEGTFCRVIDLEDGTHPIYTYGKTEAECFEKIERQNGNAQLAINAQRSSRQDPPTPPRTITPDQVMQATADLASGNPAKSAAAVATLLEAGTGVNPIEAARRDYARLAMEWESETPAFYPHAGNRQLMGNRVIALAGGKPGSVTREFFNSAFQQLQAEGLLFERTDPPQSHNDPALTTTFPGESPVQPSERPRGTGYSTGVRSTSFSAPQSPTTRALKYTAEQIRTMPEKERLRVFNDPDYIKACEHFYGAGAQA